MDSNGLIENWMKTFCLAVCVAVAGCSSSPNETQPEDSGVHEAGPDTSVAEGGQEASTPDAAGDADAEPETGSETGPDAEAGADADGGVDADAGLDADTGLDADAAEVLSQVVAPTFTPPAGTYADAQSVTLATTTKGATIRYTTDGTAPGPQSPAYTAAILLDKPGMAVLRAYATATGMTDSPAVEATYNINCTGTTPAAPSPNPVGGPQDNDFQVALTTATAETICYTLDGTTPTCLDGACTVAAQTYDAKKEVAIDGTHTDANGQVVLHAISCKAGVCGAGAMTPQTYTLQAAAPVFASPAPSPPDVAYPGANPSVSTATTGAVQLRYTSSGTLPTCTTGTVLAAPYPAKVPVTEDIAYDVIACKAGYAASSTTHAAYTVQLGTPTFSPTNAATIATAQPNVAVTIGNPSTVGVLCATSDGTTPVCTAGACTHGSSTATVSITKDSEALEAIVCGVTGKYADSAAAKSGAYTLQLAPATVAPAAGTKIPTTGLLAGVQITSSGPKTDQPYSFVCWSTDGTSTPTCACTGATAENTAGTVGPGLYKSTGAATPVMSVQRAAGATGITVRAIACDSSAAGYAPSDAPYATATWQ
jgi:hypothetical protein